MKKTALLLVLALALSLCGCGAAAGANNTALKPADSSAAAAGAGAVTFVDDLGRTVTVEHAERVATLIGSFADIWCLAGGADSIVATADDTWTSFDLPLGADVANLGAIKEIRLETLLAAEPDLVIASCNTTANVDLLPAFDEMGLNVAYFKVGTFDDYLRMLKTCTAITGRAENYAQYGEAVQAQVDAARGCTNGSAPSVLYVRATGSSCKVKNSRDSVLGEMLADLGCKNIADSDTGLLENLSIEAILRDDPEYIFVVVQGSDPTDAEKMLHNTLLTNPAWATLRAVREGRYYVMDQSLYNLKPNEQWGTAYENLAQILYGEAAAGELQLQRAAA